MRRTTVRCTTFETRSGFLSKQRKKRVELREGGVNILFARVAGDGGLKRVTGRTGNVSERMQSAASRETLQELCVGLHYRRASGTTFNTALRFSGPNFGMRTNAPNTRLRRRCYRESHPRDATFPSSSSFLPSIFFFFFYSSRKKGAREEKKEKKRNQRTRSEVVNKTNGARLSKFPFNQRCERAKEKKTGGRKERAKERERAFRGTTHLFLARGRRNRKNYTAGK